jgi:hypothetical protein
MKLSAELTSLHAVLVRKDKLSKELIRQFNHPVDADELSRKSVAIAAYLG